MGKRYIFEGTIEEVKENKGSGCLGLIVIKVVIAYAMNQQKQKPEDKSKTELVHKKENINQENNNRRNNYQENLEKSQTSAVSTEQVVYTSNIAGQDVTFFLKGFGEKIEGSYYYNVIGKEINLIEYSRNAEEIVLREFANGQTHSKLNLQIFDSNTSSINGLFTAKDGRQYDFVLYKKSFHLRG
jgi:hypothetical protein